MISLAFAVCIFYYAVIRYNCAAVLYDMYVGSLILEFAFVSSLLPLLQLVVPIILVVWRFGRSFVLSRKCSSDLASNRKNSANVLVTRRRAQNNIPTLFHPVKLSNKIFCMHNYIRLIQILYSSTTATAMLVTKRLSICSFSFWSTFWHILAIKKLLRSLKLPNKTFFAFKTLSGTYRYYHSSVGATTTCK